MKIAVVVDVLRAFSTECIAFERGAKAILLVSDADAAFRVKQANPEYLLVGETNGLPIEGFDFGNSPTELASVDVEGKILVHKTTAGVPATLRALNNTEVDRVFVTGLMTAKLTADHAVQLGPVQYIASDPSGDEDIACIDYMRGEINLSRTRQRIVASYAAQKFVHDNHSDFPRSDLDMCLRERDNGFVMEVRRGEAPMVERVDL